MDNSGNDLLLSSDAEQQELLAKVRASLDTNLGIEGDAETDAIIKGKPIARKVRPVLLFSKSNEFFFGYFDPKNIFLDNKNK